MTPRLAAGRRRRGVISSIFGKLSLPAGGDDHRRVLAVLAYLRAES